MYNLKRVCDIRRAVAENIVKLALNYEIDFMKFYPRSDQGQKYDFHLFYRYYNFIIIKHS